MRLSCGLVLGGGTVYPEFRVEPGAVSSGTAVASGDILEPLLAATAGAAGGAVFDVDLATPGWANTGKEILGRIRESLDHARQSTGIPAALRVTLSSSEARTREAIESGADIVNLETSTGLELFRRALRAGDAAGLIAAAGVVSAPAVSEIWSQAGGHFRDSGATRGGDSARPFILEVLHCLRRKQAPEVICAIAVAVCAVRTLASLEAGATGPLRAGSWDSPIVKAIRGCPVSLSDASPWEAQAAGAADLWSSSAGVEKTLADCADLTAGRRAPARRGGAGGPVARILSGSAILTIAEAIQTCRQPYQRAIAAAYAAATLLSEKGEAEPAPVSAADRDLASQVAEELLSLPESGQGLLERLGEKYGSSTLSGEIQA